MGRIIIPGEPETSTTFLTPAWVARDLMKTAIKQQEDSAAMRRVMELRESVGEPISFTGAPIGDTVTVRIPDRFKVK